MKPIQTDTIRLTLRWLSTALLMLIVGAFVYLITSERPISRIEQVSPLALRAAARTSPLVKAAPVKPASITPTKSVESASMAPPTARPSPTSPPGALELTIVHSNDTWGYLLPCG